MLRKQFSRIFELCCLALLLCVSLAVISAAILNSLKPTDGRLLFGNDLELLLRIENGNVVLLKDGNEIINRPTFSESEEAVDLASPNTDAVYQITEIEHFCTIPSGFFGRLFGFFAPDDFFESAFVHVTISEGDLTYKQYCDLRLRRHGTELGLAHFHGELTISPQTVNWDVPDTLVLMHGNKPADLRVEIGTKSKAKACWTMVEFCELPPRNSAGKREWSLIRDHDSFPVATVEYPPKLPGGDRLTQTYVLDQFC
jgi:hypothetical protein